MCKKNYSLFVLHYVHVGNFELISNYHLPVTRTYLFLFSIL